MTHFPVDDTARFAGLVKLPPMSGQENQFEAEL